MKFADLPISPEILKRLGELGFETPTPIQEKAIGPGLEGKDVIGKAETGTGKTLAFAIPIVARLDPSRIAVQSLILAPTRELAHQVSDALSAVAKVRGITVATVVGGEPMFDQILALGRGCQVVVGTPGRVLDMLRQRYLNLGWVEVAVLDEADRMLDMGFIEDITSILDRTPKTRQTMLFSATFPPQLRKIADRYMRDRLEVETARGLATVSGISQKYIRVTRHDKLALLRRFLETNTGSAYLIFLNTKLETSRVGRDLWNRGFDVATLHGGLDQDVRNRILGDFRAGKVRALVATDVAQRGLDIPLVSHVINVDVPRDPEDYVHRIGRTGRAGRAGMVLTLVDEDQRRDFERIRHQTKWPMQEVALPKGLRGWNKDGVGDQRRGGSRGRGGPRRGPRKLESGRMPRGGKRSGGSTKKREPSRRLQRAR